MAYPKYTLTGKTPAQTYENLVQFNSESSSLVNGDGNDITASLNLTVANAVSASWAPTNSVGVISSSWASSSLSSSNTLGIDAGSDVFIHSHQGSISVLATTNVFLSATGAMYMEAAGGNIEMYPTTTVKVFGEIDSLGAITASNGFVGTASYATALTSTAGLTATVYLTASVTTMSFVNGLLQSVS